MEIIRLSEGHYRPATVYDLEAEAPDAGRVRVPKQRSRKCGASKGP